MPPETIIVTSRLPAAGLVALVLLAVPAGASGASLTASPAKACYHSDEVVTLLGTGFGPSGTVRLTSDGTPIPGSLSTDATGAFGAGLRVVQKTGQKLKTYAATDQANPALAASTRLRVSAVSVRVRPTNGEPGRARRITARGFTTGRRLYAHVRRGRFKRNQRIGTLRGACHTLRTKKRLFPIGTRPGVYKLQFDTRRRYSRTTAVWARFTVTIVPVSRSSAGAAVSAERWLRAW
jgi:hypothetical protein